MNKEEILLEREKSNVFTLKTINIVEQLDEEIAILEKAKAEVEKAEFDRMLAVMTEAIESGMSLKEVRDSGIVDVRRLNVISRGKLNFKFEEEP